MKIMERLSYYIVSHEELYTFTKTLLNLIAEHDLSATGIPAFVAPVQDSYNAFDKSLKRDYSNEITEQLAAADAVRDDRFIGLRMYVDAASYRGLAGWEEAASRIRKIIDRYGADLYKQGYATQSASVNNLLTDLQAEGAAADMALIEATPWADAVQAAQSGFETLFEQRMSEEQDDVLPIVESRKALVNDLRNLMNMIELQGQIAQGEAMPALISSIEQLVANTMATARASQTRNS